MLYARPPESGVLAELARCLGVADAQRPADDERLASRVEQLTVELALVVLEDASAAILCARRYRVVQVAGGDADEDAEALPITSG